MLTTSNTWATKKSNVHWKNASFGQSTRVISEARVRSSATEKFHKYFVIRRKSNSQKRGRKKKVSTLLAYVYGYKPYGSSFDAYYLVPIFGLSDVRVSTGLMLYKFIPSAVKF